MIQETRQADSWVYSCQRCGAEYRYAKRKQLWQIRCGHQPRKIRNQSHWATCPHRGHVLATINAHTAGCGCQSSTVQVSQCLHFAEPVLTASLDRCQPAIAAAVPGYTGRTCRTCHVPRVSPAADFRLPLADSSLTEDTVRGIITGGHAVHWPCLGAIAIAAARQGFGFAVADHGLHHWQHAELSRIGVRWVDHDKPDLTVVKNSLRIPSELQAWWKPWICLASPFAVTIWVDADAVVTGDLSDLATAAARGPCISTQRLWQGNGTRLYASPVEALFGPTAVATHLPPLADINSGVLAWPRGDQLLCDWQGACLQLMRDAALTAMCPVRDQAGLVVALVARALAGRASVQFLPDTYNVPADYLPSRQSRNRKPISLDPSELLTTAIARHPTAKIVHWLGGVKPWKIR